MAIIASVAMFAPTAAVSADPAETLTPQSTQSATPSPTGSPAQTPSASPSATDDTGDKSAQDSEAVKQSDSDSTKNNDAAASDVKKESADAKTQDAAKQQPAKAKAAAVQTLDYDILEHFRARVQLQGLSISGQAERFRFALTCGFDTVATGTNGADGIVKLTPAGFGNPNILHFSSDDLSSQTCTLLQEQPTPPFSSINGQKLIMTLTPELDDKGNLIVDFSADPDDVKDGGEMVFTNWVNYNGVFAPSGSKILEGDAVKAGQYTFKLYTRDYRTGRIVDNGPVVPGGNITDAADGQPSNVGFNQIRYTYDSPTYLDQAVAAHFATVRVNKDGTRTWTVYYTAKEDTPKQPGVTAVTQQINFTVTATLGNNGTLTVKPNYPNGGLTFRNLKSTDKAKFEFSGQKVVTSEEGFDPGNTEGKFSFTVTPQDGAPAPEKTSTTNDANNNVDFGAVTISKADLGASGAKDFTYTVKETNIPSGYQAVDGDTKTVTLHAKYDAAANKVVVTADSSPLFTITNNFKPNAAEQDITVQKTAKGRDMAAGEFTFTLDQQGYEEQNKNGYNTLGFEFTKTSVASPAVKDGQSAKSDALHVKFTKPGEYTFNVRENLNGKAGVTADTNPKTLVFTVVQNEQDPGKLNVASIVNTAQTGDDKSIVPFTNTFTPAPGSSTLTVNKSLTGKGSFKGAFTFNVTGATDGITVENPQLTTGQIATKADGTAAIGNATTTVKFTKAGTYTLTVTEPDSNFANGVTSADGQKSKTVTFTVKPDSASGKLVATAQSVTFNNKYASTAASAVIRGTKKLNGTEPGSRRFTFQLLDKDNGNKQIGADVKNADDGSFAFPAINYTEAGTHHYVVREVNDGQKGVTYDATPDRDVTVTVTDNGKGQLVAAVTGNNPTYANTYGTTASVNITAKKVLNGRELKAGDFTFQLTKTDNTWNGTASNGTAPNTAPAGITFPKTYTAAGTYEYTLKELQPGVDKIGNAGTWDQTVYKVRVTIAGDNGQGGFNTATVQYAPNGTENWTTTAPTFTNTYKVNPATANINVKKTFTGRTWNDGDSFQFKLHNTAAPQGATAIDDATTTIGKPANGNANTGAFQNVSFSKAGTYTFDVTEAASTPANVKSDTHTAKVTVVVTEADGKLTPAVSYDNGQGAADNSAAVFANTYTPTPKTVNDLFTVRKTLEGRAFKAGDTFTFNLAGNGAPLPQVDGKDQTVVSVTDGASKAFGGVTFTKAGTYTYTLTEANTGISGVSYATGSVKVTVSVTDDGKGNLTVTPKYEATGTGAAVDVATAVFTNTYSATAGTTAISGTKTLDNQSGDNAKNLANGEFTFTLTPKTANAPVPANTTTTNNAAGGFAFPLNFDKDHIGSYTYEVKEQNGGKAGYTYDASVYTVTVTSKITSGNGKDTVTASVTKIQKNGTDAQAISFANVYKPTAATLDANDFITGAKTLNGRDWTDADKFAFTLAGDTAKDGATVEKTDATATKAAKTFNFGKATFPKAGTYTYTVKETVPQDATGNVKDGVTYDASAKTVTVKVAVDDANTGALKATVENGKVSFTNTYGAGSTTLTSITGTKTLNDPKNAKTLNQGDFHFSVAPQAAGAPTAADGSSRTLDVSNDAPANAAAKTANITFLQNVKYAQAGSYAYLIKETGTAPAGWAYDQSQYKVTVPVTDNGTGSLVVGTPTTEKSTDNGATFKAADAIAFTNTYTQTDSDNAPVPAVKTTLDGKNLAADDFGFTFRLTAGDASGVSGATASQVLNNDTNGNVTLPGFKFTKAGDYTFTIAQNRTYKGQDFSTNAQGLTFAANTATLKYHVADVNGKLTITADKANPTSVTFANTYRASGTSDAVTGVKAMTGRAFQNGDSFTFTIKPQGNAPQFSKANGGKVTVTPKAGDSTVDINLGTVGIANAYGDKTFNYTITEDDIPASIKGVTKDESTITVTVNAKDNGNGTYTLTPSYAGGKTNGELKFTNTYSKGSARKDITVKKTFTGRDWRNDDNFTFTVTPKSFNNATDAAELSNVPAVDITVGKPATGTSNTASTTVTFTKAGTYVYEIAESDPGLGGVKPDTHKATVTIVVSDKNADGAYDGSLHITSTTYDNSTATTDADKGANTAAAFTNAYAYKGTVKQKIEGAKTLNGRDMKADEFTFTIAPKNDAAKTVLPQAKDVKNVAAADGKASALDFGELTFTKTGTYTFDLNEKAGQLGGVSYDTHTATATVTIVDTDAQTGKPNGTLRLGSVVYDNAGATDKTAAADTAKAAFVNSYKQGSSDQALTVTKTFTGRQWKNADTFTFDVTSPVDGPQAPKTITIGKPANGTSNSASEKLTFTKAGDYAYTVKEQAGAADKGVTYDKHTATVTFHVKDTNAQGDKDGNLYVTVDGKAEFANTYKAADSAAVDVPASTTLTGRALKADEFTFTVTPKGVADAKAVATARNAADGKVNFTLPAYSEASLAQAIADGYATVATNAAGNRVWTVNYTAKEETTKLPAAVTADAGKASFDFTVTVTDDGEGHLTAVNNAGNKLAFANTYAPDDTKAKVTPTGTLTVANPDNGTVPDYGGKYAYTISSDDKTAPLPKVVTVNNGVDDAKNAIAFGDIQFTKASLGSDADGKPVMSKTFTYKVRQSGNIDHVTNDANDTKTFTVTVTDDGEGHLTVASDPAKAPHFAFTNTYNVNGVTSSPTGDGQLAVTKVLTGRALADRQFHFTLKGEAQNNGAAKVDQTKTNDAKGNVEFDAISFTKPGTYQYVLDETDKSGNGYTNDDDTHTLVAAVTDQAGQLNVVWSVRDANGNASQSKTVTFTNAYKATGTVSLKASKKLTGHALAEGQFEFQLWAGKTKPTDPDATPLQTKTNDANGNVTFDPIAYTQDIDHDDAGKTFDYVITEVDPNADGYEAYDKTVKTVSVKVTDNGDGSLRTDVTGNGQQFANQYNANGEISLDAAMTLDGRALDDARTPDFEFTLAGQGADAAVKQTVKADKATGKIGFDKLTYDQTKLGDHTYTITPVVPAGAADNGDGTATLKGYTYSTKPVTVTVTVKDNGNGTLAVTAKPAQVRFAYGYQATGTFTPNVRKVLDGRELKPNEFTFALKGDGALGTGNTNQTGKPNVDANGTVNFDPIAYTLDKSHLIDGKSFTYTVSEEGADGKLPPAVSGTLVSKNFTVKVTDNGDGTLTFTPDKVDVELTNTYGADLKVPVNFNGQAKLDVPDGSTTDTTHVAGRFNYTITGKDGAPLPERATATNDADGNVDFGAYVFTKKDLGKDANGKDVMEKTFTYTVKQTGEAPGVTLDKDATKTFTVTVTDDGEGHLTAKVSETPAFTFTNVYALTPLKETLSKENGISVKTLITGRDLNEGEFQVQLSTKARDVARADGIEGLPQTKANAADGTVTFDDVTYTKPTQTTFTLDEVDGDLGGVTYDQTVFTVRAEVVDNHDGTMGVTYTLVNPKDGSQPNEAVFDNVYAPVATDAQITANKTYKGAELRNGQFSFVLADADGKTVDEAKNDADGKVTFEKLDFTKSDLGTIGADGKTVMEKTFTYTVSEKNDKQANVTYDGRTHKVTVTLTDDGKGQLHTAVSYDDGGKVPEFVNTYTEPAKPAAPNLLGKTGAAISGGAVLMLLLLGAGLMLRKGAGSTRGAHRA